MKKAEQAKREDIDAKARVKQYASNEAQVPCTPIMLTNEQQEAFDERRNDHSPRAPGAWSGFLLTLGCHLESRQSVARRSKDTDF